MLINDVKKGMAITMTHGRVGKMADNKRGNIRMVEVTNGVNGAEIGSIYAKDILTVKTISGWEAVMLSPAQVKAAKNITAFGF